MLVGCAALAGLPPLAGFFSKDEIVGHAWEESALLGLLLLVTAFLTAYYTFRLYFRVFEGPTVVPPPPAGGHGSHGHDDVDPHLTPGHGHAEHEHHNHEPGLMILPLVVLAIGAFLFGMYPGGERLGEFLGRSPSFAMSYQVATALHSHPGERPVPPAAFGQAEAVAKFKETYPEQYESSHSLHRNLMFVSSLVALGGVFLAYLMHLKDRGAAERLAARFPNAVRILDGKYWIDEIYQAGIVEPLRMLGRAFFIIDQWIVDGLINFIGIVPQASGFVLKLTMQRGYLQGYAAAMLFGVAAILLIIFL